MKTIATSTCKGSPYRDLCDSWESFWQAETLAARKLCGTGSYGLLAVVTVLGE